MDKIVKPPKGNTLKIVKKLPFVNVYSSLCGICNERVK